MEVTETALGQDVAFHIVLDEAYRELAEQRLAGNRLTFFPGTLADSTAFADLIRPADIIAFRLPLGFELTRELFKDAASLRYIHKSGSGLDWLNANLLSELGIAFAVNAGLNAMSVAEHALALTLAVSRRTIYYVEIMRAGGWSKTLPGTPPMTITGKRVGVVGIGRIGSAYARMVQAVGADVVAYHPDPSRQMPDGVRWMALDEILSSADVVALHAPLTEQTRHMIGARELSLMKPSAILVNTSRGALIDQDALIAALQEGRIRGAGLDVFEGTELPGDSKLRSLSNAVLTPHVGGVVAEIAALQLDHTIAGVERFIATQTPDVGQ